MTAPRRKKNAAGWLRERRITPRTTRHRFHRTPPLENRAHPRLAHRLPPPHPRYGVHAHLFGAFLSLAAALTGYKKPAT